jgi:hypothetical protein
MVAELIKANIKCEHEEKMKNEKFLFRMRGTNMYFYFVSTIFLINT